MKRFFIPCILVAAVLSASSCRKDEVFRSEIVSGPKPAAMFTHAANAANPLEISFKNTSLHAESWYWQFGDGTTSTEESPVHTYSASAHYQVRLTVRSAAGYSADTAMQVLAAAPAKAAFTVSMSGPYVSFTNTSSGAEASSWDFGDNSGVSDSLSPAHLYAAAGDYDVALTVYGIAGDTVVISKKITVTDELIRGGGLEAGDKQYWKEWSQQ